MLPLSNDHQHLLIAFWRRTLDDVEFFMPLGGYAEFLRYLITDDAVRTARRVVTFQFGFNPRGNARVFRRKGDHVVAFQLTASETSHLATQGAWLPITHITDKTVTAALQETIGRL